MKEITRGLSTLTLTMAILMLPITNLVSIGVAVFTFPMESHAADSMWIEPSLINATGVSVGYKFNVTVWVNISLDINCAGWQFAMLYNINYLNATRAGYTGTGGTRSQFFEQSGTVNLMPLPPTLNGPYNSTHKYVLHGEAWSPMVPNNPYAKGLGSLSWVEFQVIAQPPEGGEIRTVLDIKTLYPSKTYVTNAQQQKISLSIYNCLFVFKSSVPPPPPPPPEGTRICVDPSEIVDPTLRPCSTFSINITIEKVADLKIVEFNLTYNPTIISWMATILNKLQNQIPTAKTMVNDEIGFVWIRLKYPEPVSVDASTSMLTIVFHVLSFGATPLDLQNTVLLNSANQPIDHEARDGFFSTLIRDVAVKSIVASREWAYAGWPVNITVLVKNEGNVKETFNVRAYRNDTLLGERTVVDLAPNEERNLLFQWDTAGISEGNYVISAEADIVPNEVDTSDNTLINGKVMILTKIHDISITELRIPDVIYQTWIVNIIVKVKNKGDLPESFEIKVLSDGNLIGSKLITDLAPITELTIDFTWNTANVAPCHNYTIIAEASQVPYELNVTDNIAVCIVKVRYMGDVNGDGIVDVSDILSIAGSYGAYPPSTRWNPYYDLDRNYVIDIMDLLLVATNYGKGCR
jgi:hypothetical protein